LECNHTFLSVNHLSAKQLSHLFAKRHSDRDLQHGILIAKSQVLPEVVNVTIEPQEISETTADIDVKVEVARKKLPINVLKYN
jgi:hypothetical protein